MAHLVGFKGRKKYVRQGTISDDVWNEMKPYRKYPDYTFGYVGSFDRTKKTDKILEKRLKDLGLSTHQVAMYMTSTTGRHLLDSGTSKKDIYKGTKDARETVARYEKEESKPQLAKYPKPAKAKVKKPKQSSLVLKGKKQYVQRMYPKVPLSNKEIEKGIRRTGSTYGDWFKSPKPKRVRRVR